MTSDYRSWKCLCSGPNRKQSQDVPSF